jgi:hypothetical protein
MSAPRKPRSDSPLRTLPEERQAQVIELMKQNSIPETRKQLMKDGLTVSTGALSDFYSWWHLRQQFKQNQSDVSTLLEQLKTAQPAMSEEQLFNYGQQLFGLLAVKNQDAESWTWIQKTRQKQEELQIERQKFRRETCKLFIEWVADEEAKKIATSTSSNADKIEALGKKMFPDWEEE